MDSIYKHYGVHIRKSGTFVYPPGTYERVDSLWAGIYETHGERSLINMNVTSEFDQLTEEENYPWYVWDVTFQENETKTITVAYELPSGLGYRNSYRYFKYILHTGARWYGTIGRADIILNLHDVPFLWKEEIQPKIYAIDHKKKQLTWTFCDLEEEDILACLAYAKKITKYSSYTYTTTS